MHDFVRRTFTGKYPPPWLGWALLLAFLALTAVAVSNVPVTHLAVR
jgi:hypothetical protein